MRMQPQELTARIVEMGAYKAALLDVSLIHFDRKFRELCESNACGNYGACWTCPPDAGDIDTWAVESMALMNNNGLMSGNDNKLFPKDNTTVEQAITMILALYNKF